MIKICGKNSETSSFERLSWRERGAKKRSASNKLLWKFNRRSAISRYDRDLKAKSRLVQRNVRVTRRPGSQGTHLLFQSLLQRATWPRWPNVVSSSSSSRMLSWRLKRLDKKMRPKVSSSRSFSLLKIIEDYFLQAEQIAQILRLGRSSYHRLLHRPQKLRAV